MIEAFLKNGKYPRNPDKANTVKQLSFNSYKWLKDLPFLHVIDDLNLVLVHGGLFPLKPLYNQPHSVIRAQLINPFGEETRWWGKDAKLHKSKKTEEESKAEGFQRWYRVYDHQQNVAFGHSVFHQPLIYRAFPDKGFVVGVDTGSCFGGMLTAAIWGEKNKYPGFLSVKSKDIYAKLSRRIIDLEN